MPSIQRVVPTVTPTADGARFEAALTTRQNPSYLAPLAHLIDPDGPSGRIGGLVESVPYAAGRADTSREVGAVQRWPQPVPSGLVISRSVEPDASDVPSDGGAFAEPEPAAETGVIAGASAGEAIPEHVVDPPVQRSTVDVAAVRTETTPTVPLASQFALEPISGVPATPSVTRDAAPQALHRGASPRSDTTAQRSLTTAPHPEPVFRPLPTVSRTLDQAPEAASTAVDQPLAPRAETGRAIALDSRDVDEAPGQGADHLAPSVSQHHDVEASISAQRSTLGIGSGTEEGEPLPGPIVASPSAALPTRSTESATATAGQTVNLQRSETNGLPTERFEPVAAGRSPRKLGFGPPIEDPPTTATAVETLSVQEWAAARDSSPAAEALAPAVEAPLSTIPDAAVGQLPDLMDSRDTAADSTGLLGDRPSLSGHSVVAPPTPVAQRIAELDPSAIRSAAPTHATTTNTALPAVALPSAQRVPVAVLPGQDDGPRVQRLPTSGGPDLGRRADVSIGPVVQRLVGEQAPDPLHTRTPVAVGWADRWPSWSSMSALPAPETRQPGVTPSAQRVVQRVVQRVADVGGVAESRAFPAPRTFAPYPAAATAGNADLGRPPIDAGSFAVAAGIAQRDADGSVVFNAPEPSTSVPSATNVQRAVQVDEMTAESAPAASPAADAPSTPAAASATGGATPAPAGAAMPNLDDLARRLYDPLAARLKAELRLDRERAGLVTDLRR